MYNSETIKKELSGIIGWRQNHDVSDFTIADSLTISSSGQYFQDIHPLLTLSNLKKSAPDFKRIAYPAWVVETQYRKADRVSVGGKDYRAKRDNSGQDPETSTDDWEIFDAFSEWLEQKTEASIIKTVREFWTNKAVNKTARTLLQSKPLFDGAGQMKDVIANSGNLVGFELVPVRSIGVMAKINKIGLQFTGVGEVAVYLFHSSQKLPIKTKVITRTKDSGVEWFSFEDLTLPYLSEGNDAGGSWFLVYDQDALGEQKAIRKDKDWSRKPCSTCNGNEIINYNIWSKFLKVSPFKVSNYDLNSGIWDLDDNIYTTDSNYGINLQISIFCDVTDIIIENKQTFENAIGLQVAADMLRGMAYNADGRINRGGEILNKAEILYELDGDSTGYKKSGIVYELSKAMKSVDIDFQKSSRICFPCEKTGVKYGSV